MSLEEGLGGLAIARGVHGLRAPFGTKGIRDFIVGSRVRHSLVMTGALRSLHNV